MHAKSSPGTPRKTPELLAPGGSLDAAFAAFEHGADAVYVGLRRFSARAEARNLDDAELGELCAWAHAAERRRRVYVALNTLVRPDEWDGPEGLVAQLELCAACGADAVIVQDAGVARVARRYFPSLRLHASTQCAIHNLEGALEARRAGFRRVTLARELTLSEIRAIAQAFPGEVEAFAHGALCYSYSGLCLYSALLRGRSGNRGACAYPCREAFRDAADPAADPALCFSMKDLATTRLLRDLAATGVASLKIEGRKKSPLYVAAAVRLYRGVLDGRIGGEALREAERELQTVFSRPWTPLHLRARRGEPVIDPDTTGHRGVPAGTVLRSGRRFLQFRTEVPIEAHDGLQVELPGQPRPYGFPVDRLRLRTGREVFAAPADTVVEIDLPQNAPPIPAGTVLHWSSSQALKRKYPVPSVNPRDWRVRVPVAFAAEPAPGGGVAFSAKANADGGVFEAREVVSGPLSAPRNPDAMRKALDDAFRKLGETPFSCASFEWKGDPGALPFLPVSHLNEVRRALADALAADLQAARTAHAASAAEFAAALPVLPLAPPEKRLLVKTDQPRAFRLAIEGVPGLRIAEVAVEWHPGLDPAETEALRAALPPEIAFRLALPTVFRSWEREPLRAWVRGALDAGQRLWEVGNLGGLGLLRELAAGRFADLDLAADWPLYAWNDAALAEWADRGITRWTLSPELSPEAAAALAARFPNRLAWLAQRDPPLFLSENCPHAAQAGRCESPSHCPFKTQTLVSPEGERLLLVNRDCRFWTLLEHPVALPPPPDAPLLRRAEFLVRPWSPDDLRHALFHLI